MKAIILKCKPGSLFRIGEGSLVDVSNIVHSDTLFSALANIYELVYESGEEFIHLVAENKLIFSSAFPLLENVKTNEFVYLLPKPKIQFDYANELGKKEKKIQFVSLSLLSKIIKSINVNSVVKSNFNLNEIKVVDDKYGFCKEELLEISNNQASFIKEVIFPKTSVHKLNREDAFYFQTDVQLIPLCDDNKKVRYKSHFYFLCDYSFNDDEYQKFITCLRILADEGIGGDRGSGKGFIEEVVIQDFDLFIFSGNNVYMSLSLINPENQSEFDQALSYDLIKRGGGSLGVEGNPDNHRKQVRMITEGSIFKSKISGRIVDVSPFVNFFKYKIYRNGKAFLIPIG